MQKQRLKCYNTTRSQRCENEEAGYLGTKSPRDVQGRRAPVEVWAKSPDADTKCRIQVLTF